jgi:hypothetical protein
MASTPPARAAAAAVSAGPGISVSGSTSANTGWWPAWVIAWTAPQKVITEVSTLDPGGRFRPRSASSMAAVQEETATACGAPTQSANSRSNATTSGPVVTQPEASTRAAASRASGVISAAAKGMRATSSGTTRRVVPFSLYASASVSAALRCAISPPGDLGCLFRNAYAASTGS